MEPAAPPFIARWDLDKTYLRTNFDTFGDLVRTAMEKPEDKRAVPGASALLRELGDSGARIHIVSGSPRQMRRRLEAKLNLDRVRWDELTLKPNLSNMMRMRWRALRDQLGYKLPVLLAARARDQELSNGAPLQETLVGDDAEADAFVYSLYADVCEGEISEKELRKILGKGRVYSDRADDCIEWAGRLDHGPVVRRILIHLDRQSRPSVFDPYGSRVVPFYNYLQAAFVLTEDGQIGPSAVLRIASEFALRHRFEADALARSYLDLLRRGHIQGKLAGRLRQALEDDRDGAEELAQTDELEGMCEMMAEYESDPPEPPPARRKTVDYVAMSIAHRGGHNRRARRWS